MLEWIAPKYVCFILLPPREQGPLWYYDAWCEKIVPTASEMLNCFEHGCSLRTRQGPKKTTKEAKLGQLRWNDKSHQKWTWNSPLTKGKRDDWVFEDVEIFSPPRYVLLKRADEMPDLYFQVSAMNWCFYDDDVSSKETKANYWQALVIAVKNKLLKRQELEFMSLVQQLSLNLMNAPLYTKTQRIWGLNYFESLYLDEFVYFGVHKDELPDLKKTKKRWKRMN